MRRLALALAFSCVAFMFGAGPAMADNGPHRVGQGVIADSCAGCHRIHTAKTAELTIDEQPALCYSCHGGGATGSNTDVVDGQGKGTITGALRGGGFKFALIDSARTGKTDSSGGVPLLNAGRATTSSHAVDGEDAPAWGMGQMGASTTTGPAQTIQLRCASCHDPHGNGNFRILRPVPLQGGFSPGISTATAPNLAGTNAGFSITDETAKVYTTTDYWKVAENNTAPNPTTVLATGFINNIAQWCSQCHTRYLATRDSGCAPNTGRPGFPPCVTVPFTTDPNQRSRSETTDPDFMFRHTSSQGGESGKSCIKCHVAHGSDAQMNGDGKTAFSATVLNPDGSTGRDDPLVPDSKLLRIDNRGTCQMCHNR